MLNRARTRPVTVAREAAGTVDLFCRKRSCRRPTAGLRLGAKGRHPDGAAVSVAVLQRNVRAVAP